MLTVRTWMDMEGGGSQMDAPDVLKWPYKLKSYRESAPTGSSPSLELPAIMSAMMLCMYCTPMVWLLMPSGLHYIPCAGRDLVAKEFLHQRG